MNGNSAEERIQKKIDDMLETKKEEPKRLLNNPPQKEAQYIQSKNAMRDMGGAVEIDGANSRHAPEHFLKKRSGLEQHAFYASNVEERSPSP